jgi:hypothetical protein
MREKVNFVCNIREDYREGRRAGRGALLRGGRAAQVIAQESVEEHIRGSVERLDNQFSTLHQDVATLSCEVLYMDPSFQSDSESHYVKLFYTHSATASFSVLRDLALRIYCAVKSILFLY